MFYLSMKFLHIATAVVSLGAMLSLPMLVVAMRRSGLEPARTVALRAALERNVSVGGMALVASGLALTGLRGWGEVRSPWLGGAIGLIVVALAFEAWLDRRPDAANRANAMWLSVRALPYVCILALMVFKPT